MPSRDASEATGVGQAELFATITVYCFFGCGHAIRSTSAHDAHDAMERHYYSDRHAAAVASIVERLR